jgi:hypothetical protein
VGMIAAKSAPVEPSLLPTTLATTSGNEAD